MQILTCILLTLSLTVCATAGPGAEHSGQLQDSAPSECGCPPPYDPGTPAGVVWLGASPPGLDRIARLLAPMLWFSPDEPLLVLREDGVIPQPHPCDRRAAGGAVVYYQATSIVLRLRERVTDPPEEDSEFFRKVDHFVLTYFFYYDEDRGIRPHPHDIEAVNLVVHLDWTEDGCYRIRVSRIEGLAHGLDWYTNILRVERDTAFPPVILVEEGKHASCPDRNADGLYTPGYDVNARVNDAWGVRDVVGSAILMGARYQASMSKPRTPEFRLFPPDDAPLCATAGRRVQFEPNSLGRYELRPGRTVPFCEPPGPEPERLIRGTQVNRLGAEFQPRQYDSEVQKVLADPENATRWISAVNARLDSMSLGLLAQGPGLDLREVWLVPRAHISRDWFIDALVTPSASRWVDWYAAAGFERRRMFANGNGDSNGNGNGVVSRGFGGEVGVKFRLRVPGRSRWALLGYRFGGVRIGVRAHGFTRVQDPRLVVELGAGVF